MDHQVHGVRQFYPFSVAQSAAIIALFTLATSPVRAHEKWFQETYDYPLRPDLLLQPLPLFFLAATLLVTLAAGLLWRARKCGVVPGPESLGATSERRCALYGLVPLLLAIHVAVPLLVSGVQGKLFSVDNDLYAPWSYFMGLAQIGVALALVYGAFTRMAAVLLAALWLMGVLVVGLEGMLDNALYLGFAAFFLLAGRGPISIDRMVLPRLEPSAQMMQYAVPALRMGLGVSLIVVAFTEKLANLPLANAFLIRHPLNFTPALGIPMSNEVFILCCGTVELLVGLWLLLGIFPREIVLIAWVPINMSLTVFNWIELIGHLPIYGIMAVLLLWAPGRENLALWVRGLREGPLAILEPTSVKPDTMGTTPMTDKLQDEPPVTSNLGKSVVSQSG